MQSIIHQLEHTRTVHIGRRSTILSAEGVAARFGSGLPSVPIVRCAEQSSVSAGPLFYVLIKELPMVFVIGLSKLEQIISNEDFWVPSANILDSYQPQIIRPISNSVRNTKIFWHLSQKPVEGEFQNSKEFSMELRVAGIFEPEQETVLKSAGILQRQDTGVFAGSIHYSRPANGSENPVALYLHTPCVLFDATVSFKREKKSCKRMLWCNLANQPNQLHYTVIALDSDSCLLLSFLFAPLSSPVHLESPTLRLERVNLFTNLETAEEYQKYSSNEFYDKLFSKPILLKEEKNYRYNITRPSKILQQHIGSNMFKSAAGSPVQAPPSATNLQYHSLQTHTGLASKFRGRLGEHSPDRQRKLESLNSFHQDSEDNKPHLSQAVVQKGADPLQTFKFDKKFQPKEDQASFSQELAILSKRKVLDPRELDLLEQVISGVSPIKSVSNSKNDCMVLQEALRKLGPRSQPRIIDAIFRLSVESVSEVSCSIYGNFLMQIMISKLSSDQRIQMLRCLLPAFEQIVCHPKGIFCLQFLIEQMQLPLEKDILLQCITPSVSRTVKDPQAGFVYKKAVQLLDEGFSYRLWQLIRRNLADACCDKYGICVVKFIITKFETSFDFFKMIAQDFIKIINKSKLNSHFNFGVQHLIEVVNKQGWVLEEVEGILASYFSEDNRIKIRSVSVAHSIVLILSYHRKAFIDNLLKQHWANLFGRPLTPQESRIFKSVQDSSPDLKPYVKMIKMMSKRQHSIPPQQFERSPQLPPSFAHR